MTFSATPTVGTPAQIVANSAQTQLATAGGPVGVLPSVIVEDANGNPVSDVSVAFTVSPGSGLVSGTPVSTDPSGIATVGIWTLGASAGTNTLTATVAGVSASVTFTATGTITVTTVDSIADISVANGTPLSSVALPSTVGVTLSNSGTGSADVTWDGGSPTYDGSTAGSYVFTGTLSDASEGATIPSDLTATVTVKVGAPTVTTVDSIADISVANGTPLSSVALPSTVGVTLSNSDTGSADVTWDGGSPTYDGSTAGSYVFTGTLSDASEGATIPSDLTATVTVKVGAPTVTTVDSIADISVANGTPLSSVALPSTVGVTLSNSDTGSADVAWDGGSPTYDGSTAGSYVFTGTLSDASEGATIPSDLTATVTVKVQS